MDYGLHQLIEAAALEAAEPAVANDLYRLHAEVARLPRASTAIDIAGPAGISTLPAARAGEL